MEQAQAAARRDPCPVLQRISRIRLDDADNWLFHCLSSCGLAMKVPITSIDLGEGFKYPCLLPKDVLEAMVKEGYVNRVLGVPFARASDALQDFWRLYQLGHPGHDIFSGDERDFRHVIPFYLHGDGGRIYKKESIMVLSMFPALGRGSSRAPTADFEGGRPSRKRSRPGAEPAHLPSAPMAGEHVQMGVNLVGNSLASRFLFTAIHSDHIKKDHHNTWLQLLGVWAEKLCSLYTEGFEHQGQRWRVAVIGLTGDAPFLRDAGLMNRSFNNIRKSEKSDTFLPGVCHLCLAGRTNGAGFEDLDFLRAAWVQTMRGNNILPWEEPSPLLDGMLTEPDNLPAFFMGDMFHIYYLGVGKEFCASALVYMLKSKHCLKKKTMDKSIHFLNEQLKRFQIERKVSPLACGKLSWDLLDYNGPRMFPKGKWSKGMDTGKITKFVEILSAELLEGSHGDTHLKLIHDASVAIGTFVRTLFAGGFFLTKQEAEKAIHSGYAFLCTYQKLARLSSEGGKQCLYKLKPKAHAMTHLVLDMWEMYQHDTSCVVNCIGSATFMQEDFVGIIGRMSRRVSPRVQGQKVLHRYLCGFKGALAEEI